MYCTFTPKTRCNPSSKEHQCRALTAAWKEQGAASLTVAAPSKPFFHFVFVFRFFCFWHHKIHFNLALRAVWWALITRCALCFRKVLILLWYFILCDFAKRKLMGAHSTTTEMEDLFMDSFLQNTSHYGLQRTKYLKRITEKDMKTFIGTT